MSQLDFLMVEKISMRDVDYSGSIFKIKKLVYLFCAIPAGTKNLPLEAELTLFAKNAISSEFYMGSDFVVIAEKLIAYYQGKLAEERVVSAVGYLCQVHFEVSELYHKYNIGEMVGQYFVDNWRYFSQKKSVTIGDLVLFYYECKFRRLLTLNPSASDIVKRIGGDEYLGSKCGVYHRRNIIIELYNSYFKNRSDGRFFLSEFKDDETIRKLIER